jgi:predicted ATPase
VSCLSEPALVLWYLGYPDQALRKSQEALTRARELAHPYTLAFALNWAAVVHQHRGEGQAVQERAEAQIGLASEQGFPDWLAWGTIWRGWALAEQGQEEEGIAQMLQGLAALRATGAEIVRPYWLALLAEAYGKAGQVKEGLNALAEALAQVGQTGERIWEAELYRLGGELSLRMGEGEKGRAGDQRKNRRTGDGENRGEGEGSGFPLSDSPIPRFPDSSSESSPILPFPHSSPEACFLKAIEIARRQQAKSLELRATMSLARLWKEQGKKDAARQMLAEIYGWFTEGFDTADLKEAKALLETLA